VDDEEMREQSIGTCGQCGSKFHYYLVHSGFNNSSYAYCDKCGCTALLDCYDKRFPPELKAMPLTVLLNEIPKEAEQYLEPCDCGGRFRKGAAPCCPACGESLSAASAAKWIEANAPGREQGWRWQRSWSDVYAIVIANRSVTNNFIGS
jgi:hypothetical protein